MVANTTTVLTAATVLTELTVLTWRESVKCHPSTVSTCFSMAKTAAVLTELTVLTWRKCVRLVSLLARAP